ncbi:MAG: hypothetical protein JJU37_09670 [Balneolaceae bacterium]|nr:hypothetical protein [Balneolaceae bacterium]
MTIRILDLARDDLIDGYHFYEKQSVGLGSYFLDNLYSDIESLKFTAGAHAVTYKDFHRALSKRFPWAIYYSQRDQNVYIHAVTDCRRDPDWIQDHISRS